MPEDQSSKPSPQSAAVSIVVWMLGGLVLAAVGALGTVEFLTNFQRYGLPHAILLGGMSAMTGIVGLRMTIDAVGDLSRGGTA